MSRYYEKVNRDRFDEEEAIMDCWKVVDDIGFVWRQMLDSEEEMDKDEICNILLGMEQLYDRKFNELLKTFTISNKLNGPTGKTLCADEL